MINFGKRLRNVGSRAASTAEAKAQTTSLTSSVPKHVRHTGRGSSAGLNASKSAWITPDGPALKSPKINMTVPGVDSNRGTIFRERTIPSGRNVDLRKPKGLF